MGLCQPPHDVHTKQSSYLSRAWDTGARSCSDGAMRTFGGRLNFKTGTNTKKLRVVTSKERTVATDRSANYRSRIDDASMASSTENAIEIENDT